LAVTIDLSSTLFREVLEMKQYSIYPLHIPISEIKVWDKIIERLKALELGDML
jgi:hypothetical protein